MTQTPGFFPVLLFAALISLNYHFFFVCLFCFLFVCFVFCLFVLFCFCFFFYLVCPPCCQSIFSALLPSSIYFTLRFLVSLTLKLMNLQTLQGAAIDQERLAHSLVCHPHRHCPLSVSTLSQCEDCSLKSGIAEHVIANYLTGSSIFFFHFPTCVF